ncbi:MAG: hypothetical protein HRU20_14295 [Pseudomonadales bacterium]|nr:hypothetical protein [Pseudomonadales bacterium]
MKEISVFILIFLSLIFSGCKDSEPNFSKEKRYLDENKAKWIGHKRTNYEMLFLCDCDFKYSDISIIINVENSTVSDAFYRESGDAVPIDRIAELPTIEVLFEIIEKAISDKVEKFDVTYDDDYGYPDLIIIDPDKAVDDDEYAYWVPNLK